MENMSHSEEDECYIEEEKNENGNDKTTDSKEVAVLSANDILNKQCVSYEEAYECYVRVGVREKKCYATTSKIRKQKPETRRNCNTMLSIYLDKSCSMWKVRKIVEDHNHPMILLKFVHQIPNHRTMTDADKAQVDSMHRHDLPPSKIMGLITGQAIGYEFAEDELMMLVRHSLTDDDKLEHLFWADDLSRFDYQYFDEQTKSYKWLLDNFSEAMMNKHPSFVITDVSPIKDPEFREEFKKCLYAKFECDEFEEYWHDMVKRCESINSFIKSFVDSRDNILALVQNLERALRDYRNNENVAEFKTINGEHVPTTGLHSLERHAVSVYTREIFWKILEEIKGQDTQKMVCQCQRWDSYGIPYVLCDETGKDQGIARNSCIEKMD
ncbi:hypothetical protein AHAS_Ahas11G0180800 [Arachis hypogaea]